jgi:hypothetical protein
LILVEQSAHALEIGVAFRKRPADKDYLQHGDKNIFSSSLHLLAELLSDYNFTPPPTSKNSQQHIFIPNNAAVCSGCIYG